MCGTNYSLGLNKPKLTK